MTENLPELWCTEFRHRLLFLYGPSVLAWNVDCVTDVVLSGNGVVVVIDELLSFTDDTADASIGLSGLARRARAPWPDRPSNELEASVRPADWRRDPTAREEMGKVFRIRIGFASEHGAEPSPLPFFRCPPVTAKREPSID